MGTVTDTNVQPLFCVGCRLKYLTNVHPSEQQSDIKWLSGGCMSHPTQIFCCPSLWGLLVYGQVLLQIISCSQGSTNYNAPAPISATCWAALPVTASTTTTTCQSTGSKPRPAAPLELDLHPRTELLFTVSQTVTTQKK